jgi:transcriptional regulator with XRE-family HTH domain
MYKILVRQQKNINFLYFLFIVMKTFIFKVQFTCTYKGEGQNCMLSKRLKAARKMNNLTQEELAIKVKTTKGTISNYENRHSTPSNEMLIDLANVLGVTTDYLLGNSDKPDGKGQNKINEQDEKEFDDFLNDPDLKLWFKEVAQSPEQQREELYRFWRYIKDQERDRKPVDNQK